MTACSWGGRDDSIDPLSGSRAELSRLLDSTLRASGLGIVEADGVWSKRECENSQTSGSYFWSWALTAPEVGEEDGRSSLRSILEAWEGLQAARGADVIRVLDDGVETKETPAVHLYVDEMTVGAVYWPGVGFSVGAHGPCVETNQEVASRRPDLELGGFR